MKVERDWEPTKLLFAQESQGEGLPGSFCAIVQGRVWGYHPMSWTTTVHTARMPPQTREARWQPSQLPQLSYPVTMTKTPLQKSLTEQRVCCSSQLGAQSLVVRRARQQDPDIAGHTVSTPVRRVQRMHATAQLLLSVYVVSTHPSQGTVLPAADWFSHPSCHTPDNS